MAVPSMQRGPVGSPSETSSGGNVAEPSRLWLDHVQRQDAAATFHEGQVEVEAASSRLPSMHPRRDAAATLPPTHGGAASCRHSRAGDLRFDVQPLDPAEEPGDPSTECRREAERSRLSRNDSVGREVMAKQMLPQAEERASLRNFRMGSTKPAGEVERLVRDVGRVPSRGGRNAAPPCAGGRVAAASRRWPCWASGWKPLPLSPGIHGRWQRRPAAGRDPARAETSLPRFRRLRASDPPCRPAVVRIPATTRTVGGAWVAHAGDAPCPAHGRPRRPGFPGRRPPPRAARHPPRMRRPGWRRQTTGA